MQEQLGSGWKRKRDPVEVLFIDTRREKAKREIACVPPRVRRCELRVPAFHAEAVGATAISHHVRRDFPQLYEDLDEDGGTQCGRRPGEVPR